jgi:hypothetical protein
MNNREVLDELRVMAAGGGVSDDELRLLLAAGEAAAALHRAREAGDAMARQLAVLVARYGPQEFTVAELEALGGVSLKSDTDDGVVRLELIRVEEGATH